MKLNNDPKIITMRGKLSAVVVSYEVFRRLPQSNTGLSQFFRQSPLCEAELDLGRSPDLSRECKGSGTLWRAGL